MHTSKVLLTTLPIKPIACTHHKIYITYLPRGSFMGEMSFISKAEASANVISEEDVSYIEWTNKELSKIKSNNKIFWTKIQNILLNDLVAKIKRSNS